VNSIPFHSNIEGRKTYIQTRYIHITLSQKFIEKKRMKKKEERIFETYNTLPTLQSIKYITTK